MAQFLSIREKRDYRNSRGKLARLASMNNDYKIEFYFKGNYPTYRAGMKLPQNRTKRIEYIKENPEKGRGNIPVGDVAEMLMVKGIPGKSNGKRGRPRKKVWRVFDIARKKYHKKWKRFVDKNIASLILKGEVRSIYEGYWKLRNVAVDDIKDVIWSIRSPTLEQSTINYKKKLFSTYGGLAEKPLIETMRMVNALRGRVVKINRGGGRPKKMPEQEEMYRVTSSRGDSYLIPKSSWENRFRSLWF